MLKQLFSLNNELPSAPKGIRASSFFLALYVALLPIATGLTGLIGSDSPLNYIAALYFAAFCIEQVLHPGPLFRKEFLFVYCYFFYMLLSCLWKSNKAIDWQFTTFLTTALLFLTAASRSYSDKELKLFVIASMLSIAIVFAVVAKSFPSHRLRIRVRVVQLMDPNDFGCGLCVVIAMIMAMSLQKKNWWMIIVLAMLFLTVILSSSRGAMLMTVVMMLWWIVAAAKKKRIIVPLIPIIFAAIFLYALVVIFPSYIKLGPKTIQYILQRMNPATLFKDGGAGRIDIWRAALATYTESSPLRMLFGYGHGAFINTVEYLYHGEMVSPEAHNMYLKALLEGGAVGLILLLLAFLQMFLYSIKNNNLWGTLAVIGFALEGFSLHAQVFRVFAWAFIVAAIFKGGESYEVLFSAGGDGDRPCLQG